MNNKTEGPVSQHASSDLNQRSKRNLVKGLAATPVILALGHRPAFGQICSLSGFGSIQAGTHLSHHPNAMTTSCNTYSHGGWKTVTSGSQDWQTVAPVTPFTRFKDSNAFGSSSTAPTPKGDWSLLKKNGNDTEALEDAKDAYPGAVYTPSPSGSDDPILLEVLVNGDDLARDTVNLLLNAIYAHNHSPMISFYKPWQVIQLWNLRQAETSPGSGVWIPTDPLSDLEYKDLITQAIH